MTKSRFIRHAATARWNRLRLLHLGDEFRVAAFEQINIWYEIHLDDQCRDLRDNAVSCGTALIGGSVRLFIDSESQGLQVNSGGSTSAEDGMASLVPN